ncbi:hypothetical protein D3C78_1716210 [compost metagenome]
MVWYGGNNDIFPVEQMCSDQQTGLIMQNIMPPLLGDELRDDHRHLIVRRASLALHRINEFTQGMNNASIRRVQGNQSNVRLPFLPLFLED